MNTQQRLIDYLVNATNVDYARIGKLLATNQPEIFMGLVDGTLDASLSRTKYAFVVDALASGQLVPAVKELRIIHGFGLKEALDIAKCVLGEAIHGGWRRGATVYADRASDFTDRYYEYADSVKKAGFVQIKDAILGVFRHRHM